MVLKLSPLFHTSTSFALLASYPSLLFLQMDLLIRMGANVNGYDCDAIEKIVLERRPPLSPYYNPKFVPHEKRPLSHASTIGDMDIVKLLLRYGAIVTEPDVRLLIIPIGSILTSSLSLGTCCD